MSRKTYSIALAGGIGLMVLVLVLAIGWFVSAGALHVYVSGSEHQDLHLVIPGAFVQAGLFFLPEAALAQVDDEAGGAAGPAWRPLLREACDALASSPEGEYVRIESADERVIISKTRRHLLVHVESAAENLRLEIPLRSLRSCGRLLATR
jgi:hypothetical protein